MGSVTNGLRLSAINSTNAQCQMISGSNSVTTHNNNGTTLTGVSSIGFSGGKTIDGNYGNIYEATLNTTTWTSGVDNNVSNALSLPAGTYSLHWICTFRVINSNVSVTAYAAGVTTSTSGFTDIISRGTLCNTINLNEYFSSTGSTVITFNSSVNIYLRCNCVFATANRIEFNAPASSLRAIKLC